MTATVTVLGASGTIAVPFQSAVNATFSAQLANQISVALGSTLTATPYNPSAATAIDPQDQLVIGGSAPAAPAASSYVLPNNYVAVVNNANSPVTVTAGVTPVSPTMRSMWSGLKFDTPMDLARPSSRSRTMAFQVSP